MIAVAAVISAVIFWAVVAFVWWRGAQAVKLRHFSDGYYVLGCQFLDDQKSKYDYFTCAKCGGFRWPTAEEGK
jgi:hypothetical protein